MKTEEKGSAKEKVEAMQKKFDVSCQHYVKSNYSLPIIDRFYIQISPYV